MPSFASPLKRTWMSPPSLLLAYSIDRPWKVTGRSTCSGMSKECGRVNAVPDTVSRLSKSVNDTAQKAAKSMSARVTEKTKRGQIQFQKFHFFFRGQCPERLPRMIG